MRTRTALAWAPVLLGLLATLVAIGSGEDFWEPLATVVVLALSTYVGLRYVSEWAEEDGPARERLRARLDGVAERVTSRGSVLVSPGDLRPGEEVVVRASCSVPADGTVTQGGGTLQPWEGAHERIDVGEGDRVIAGGMLESGELHVACSKTGPDRALSPLLFQGTSAIHNSIWPARWARNVADVGALLFAGVCAGLVWLQGGTYAAILTTLGSVWGATSHPVARALPSVCCRRWLGWAQRHGILFPHAALLDHAATVSSAAFCVRGTVLHGEPEVAEVHALHEVPEEEILSLAAGAESVVHHPVAAAILRAARVRNIDVDPCRSHNTVRGMGVRCMSSKGDLIVLGSRELLLTDRISVALAEETLRTLESRGLTTLMIAQNGHLVGVLALQDSLRAGAKAAVQVLLDEHIEPVLISGDSRATTEAVAHALAVEHVRPEISAAGRAREVQSLQEAGGSLAVIGTSPRDDPALAAAPVAIVLGGASLNFRDARRGRERAIGLASRQVIAAPLALLTARRIRTLGTRALFLCFLPAAAAAAGSASLLVPLYVAPLFAAVGAAWAARTSLAARGPFPGLSPANPERDR